MDHNLRQQLQALNSQASDCRQQGDFAGAIHHLQSAIPLVENHDSALCAKVHATIGLLHLELKNLKGAATSFRDSASCFEKADNHSARAAQIGNLGSIHRDLEQYPEAITYYNEALEIFIQEKFEPGIADQHANIGFALAQTGETGEAITHFSLAHDLYAKCGQQERAAMCSENIAALNHQG